MSDQVFPEKSRVVFRWAALFCVVSIIPLGYAARMRPIASPPSRGVPRLAARRLSWDFGRVTAGPVLTKGFQIANRGRRRRPERKNPQL